MKGTLTRVFVIPSVIGTTVFKRILQEIFIFANRPDGFWNSSTLQLNGYWVYFLEISRPGREVDRSPPCSAEVKNERSYTSTFPMCLHGVYMDNLNFTFTPSNNIFTERRGGGKLLLSWFVHHVQWTPQIMQHGRKWTRVPCYKHYY